jgi:hypothetical protein
MAMQTSLELPSAVMGRKTTYRKKYLPIIVEMARTHGGPMDLA